MANTDVLLMLSGPSSDKGADLDPSWGGSSNNVSLVTTPANRGPLETDVSGSICPGVTIAAVRRSFSASPSLSVEGSHFLYDFRIGTTTGFDTLLLYCYNGQFSTYDQILSATISLLPATATYAFSRRLYRVGSSVDWVDVVVIIEITKALLPASWSNTIRQSSLQSHSADGTADIGAATGFISPQLPRVNGLGGWTPSTVFYKGGLDFVMAFNLPTTGGYAISMDVNTTAKTVVINVPCPSLNNPGSINNVQYTLNYTTDFQDYIFIGPTTRHAGLLLKVDTVLMKQSGYSTISYSHISEIVDAYEHYAPKITSQEYSVGVLVFTLYLYNRTALDRSVTVKPIQKLSGSALGAGSDQIGISTDSTTVAGDTGSLNILLYQTTSQTVSIPANSYRKLGYYVALSSMPPSGTSALLNLGIGG